MSTRARPGGRRLLFAALFLGVLGAVVLGLGALVVSTIGVPDMFNTRPQDLNLFDVPDGAREVLVVPLERPAASVSRRRYQNAIQLELAGVDGTDPFYTRAANGTITPRPPDFLLLDGRPLLAQAGLGAPPPYAADGRYTLALTIGPALRRVTLRAATSSPGVLTVTLTSLARDGGGAP